MRATKVVMTVVIVMVVLVGIGLAGTMVLGIMGLLPQNGGRLFGMPKLVNEQSWSADEINSLVVDYGSESITLRRSTDGQVVLKEYMSRHDEDMLAATALGNGALSIRSGNRPWSIGLLGWNVRIELYVPADWACDVALESGSGGVHSEDDFHFAAFAAKCGSGSVRLAEIASDGDIALSTGSGGVSAERLTAGGRVSISASSGSLRPGRVEAGGEITAKTGSGSIRFEEARGSQVSAQANSGSVNLERLEGVFALKSGSGGVQVESGAGHGTAETTSGSVRVQLDGLTGNLTLGTGSGGCRLSLPVGSSFNLLASTGSGGLNVPDGGSLSYDRQGNVTGGGYGADPAHTVTMHTGSGSVRLEFD